MNAAKPPVVDASPQPFSAQEKTRAYDTMTDPLSRESAHVSRRIVVFFALFAALVACCALTWHIAWQRGIDELRVNAANRVDRTTNTLKSMLDRYEYLPYLLSRHPVVQDVLDDPSPANVERADRYLEDLNARACVKLFT